jgi:hypothetical protein
MADELILSGIVFIIALCILGGMVVGVSQSSGNSIFESVGLICIITMLGSGYSVIRILLKRGNTINLPGGPRLEK